MESTTLAPNGDSLDASDVAFSQEELLSSHSSSESSDDSLSISDRDAVVTDEELRELGPAPYLSNPFNFITKSGSALCEDIYSRLYHDYDDERFSRGHWDDANEERRAVSVAVIAEDLEARERAQRNGGLDKWNYDSPFEEVSVQIDNVNQTLESRFLEEANTALDRVINDIASTTCDDANVDFCDVTVSPLACLKTFITDCLLEKLRYMVNRVLHQRKKAPTSKNELLGLVILHVLCAAYNESPTTVCDETESEHFFQMGLSAERYHEVWGALCGSKERRATHDYSSTGWSRIANRATTMITDIESETASINRELLYVPSATVLSLDDDHLRMASRAVVELTYLRQHNNPKKGLGPVGNALCSALNPFFLACHFTRTGEIFLHTWERLVQLLQGASTNGALRPMPEAIFAADRGYNSKETIEFLSDVLGASLIGTHKRDLCYPFVFGDGPISSRHKGMVVSERGARAVYTARLKSIGPGSRSSQVRRAEACLYRESCSGRIAALIHNNSSLFPSRCFTVVCREAFRTTFATQKLDEILTVYDDFIEAGQRARRTADGMPALSNARKCAERVLSQITVLTFYQSEDPVWFLLRAFRFTSRTGHGFLAAVARDFDNRMKGLVWLLQGKSLSPGTEALQGELIVLIERIKHKWEHVLTVLGIKMTSLPRPSSRRIVAERVTRSSSSRINYFTKNDLQGMLAVFERGMEARATKADLVAAVNQLKEDIANNVLDLEVDAEVHGTIQQQAESASKSLSLAFKEASLTAWEMKPLVATAGMREGSRNEVELLKALVGYHTANKGAYRRKLSCSTYGWDATFVFNIKHLRCTGLVESKGCSMLADSPDAILVASDVFDIDHASAVEIKTMTSVRTIEAATNLSQKYGPVVSLENVGMDENSTDIFRELVPTTEYRAQVLHHAATLGVNQVLFIVGTGGSMTEGRILYSCIIEFAQYLRHGYTYVMDCVRVSCFDWVGMESKHIPPEYDGLLRNSHASDLYTFVSYYNLSRALRKLVISRGEPIPPCRMIRLTPAVYFFLNQSILFIVSTMSI